VKYIKIELHSYYGSEHFCPISVIRTFGTSLFDEVERIDKPEPIDYINRDENSVFEESMLQTNPGQDIFGSAKKAVYNIFSKALNCKYSNLHSIDMYDLIVDFDLSSQHFQPNTRQCYIKQGLKSFVECRRPISCNQMLQTL